MAATKTCTKCNKTKKLSEFLKNCLTKDGLSGHCRDCKQDYYHSEWGTSIKIYNNQKRVSKERGFPPPDYTQKELYMWMVSQPNWNELYNGYIDSNFNRFHAPSCDRIDDYQGYSLMNLRLTSWQDNKNKGHRDRRYGVNTKVSKAVNQLDKKTGEIIASYVSMAEAMRNTGIHTSAICKVARGTFKQTGGFGWEYVNE